jgi:flagellar FliL protein
MSVTADPTQSTVPVKRSKLPLVIGFFLALLGAGGGFFVVSTGLLASVLTPDESGEEVILPPIQPVAFIALDPLIINLPDPSDRRFMRFAAQIEVAPEHLAEVEAIKPRIVDVMNGYLRAVEASDFDDPAALARLRAQMLRRVQVAVGGDRVRDLLIMEFVLN